MRWIATSQSLDQSSSLLYTYEDTIVLELSKCQFPMRDTCSLGKAGNTEVIRAVP